jgi:integrase
MMKMSEVIKKYLKIGNGSFKYQLSVGSNLKRAQVFLGNPDISEITTGGVMEFSASLAKTLKPSSVNRILTNLHSLLVFAQDSGLVDKVPKFKWYKEDNERVRWLAPEEEVKLLSLLPKEVSAFCEILLHTGMRRGELLSLTQDNVDGDYIRLWKTKTGKPRSVPMSERAKELVKQHVPFNLPVTVINKAWNQAKQEMGLEHDNDFVLHTLRHTTATRMLERTNNIAIVQRMLGHSKIQTTMRYAHISDQQLLQAVR